MNRATGYAQHGLSAERTLTMGDELARRDVFLNCDYIGQIIYRRRKLTGRRGSEYGWQRAKAPKQSRLMTQHEALVELKERKI